MTHKCAVKPCPIQIEEPYLMCGQHWSLVPKHLQQLIGELQMLVASVIDTPEEDRRRQQLAFVERRAVRVVEQTVAVQLERIS